MSAAKPTALKLVQGNAGKRKINHAEPKPKVVKLRRPVGLPYFGKAAWNKINPILTKMGVLTEADQYTLERLCDCYSDIMESRKLVKKYGRVYTTPKGLMKANPAVAMVRAADAQFKAYMADFGMSPSSRTKLVIEDDDEDPLKRFGMD